MKTIRFEPNGVETVLHVGETVLDAARRAGIPISAVCGGLGHCGQCLAQVVQGKNGAVSDDERIMLTGEELREGWRLACQMTPEASLVVQAPYVTFDGLFKSSLGMQDVPQDLPLQPAVIRMRLNLQPPTLEDNRSDAVRLLAELGAAGYENCRFHILALRDLPGAIRGGGWRVEVWLRQSEIIAVHPAGEAPVIPYGLAYDIGTTTVAAYLVALTSGEVVGISSAGNTQDDFGSDVMSRIAAAGQGHLGALQNRVVEVMNGLAARLCEDARITPERITDVTVVGNACMAHLLLGVPPTHLGLAPYVPAFNADTTVPADILGLNAHPAATVTVLPNIGGFVGSDTVGAVLASGIDQSEEVCLLLDIGTNAEVVLGSKEGLIACSTAAGPAFEGACIADGMRAEPGAIDRVSLVSGSLRAHTISDRPARGLAGSGLVSIAATLLKAGLLDRQGFLKRDALAQYPWFRQQGQGLIELASDDDAAAQRPVYLREEDISQLQLARAAMMAGLDFLLEEMQLTVDAIERVLLAGAFGNYMDRDDAAVVGLFPSQLAACAEGIGNAAGAGAIRALVNVNERQRARMVAKATRYVELSARADFNDRFVKHLPFPSPKGDE